MHRTEGWARREEAQGSARARPVMQRSWPRQRLRAAAAACAHGHGSTAGELTDTRRASATHLLFLLEGGCLHLVKTQVYG